ncbi:MAG: A/G-specific adenine glycosylase [Verrucomicrobiales bacterium]|nr:A/G-specific adenine glycosylase [Verrucomicrobiota bacterium JB025]
MLKPRQEINALDRLTEFRDAVVGWFGEHGLDHPWRRTRDAYEVLVSEVMLQQTQVATVLKNGAYGRFLEAFPDLESLAVAGDDELLKAWEGLGYYRRARMLRETARAVVEGHGGEFPRELAGLMALPGVGMYTAGALRAFAFREPAVLVDGNVVRVLARLMDFRDAVDGAAGQRVMWEWAGELADEGRPAAYHAGLMELGQRVCRRGVPDCPGCPVARFCGTRVPADLPVKKRKVAVTEVDEHALWVTDGAGRVLMQRETGKRRTGLWKLPVRDAGEVAGMPVVRESTYAITRYRVRLKVHGVGPGGVWGALREGEEWLDAEEVAGVAMAAPFRKVVALLSAGD